MDVDVVTRFKSIREGFVRSNAKLITCCPVCNLKYCLQVDVNQNVCVNCGTYFMNNKVVKEPNKGIIYSTKDDKTVISPLCSNWDRTEDNLYKSIKLLECDYKELDSCILHRIETNEETELTIDFKNML